MRHFLLAFLTFQSLFLFAQDSLILNNLKFRSIGPYRGGRSTAACGDLKNKQLFYFGSTGGGVWKTKDGGRRFTTNNSG